MEDYHKIQKQETFSELFLPENDFKTCSAINFPKKHPDIGDLETNQRQNLDSNFFYMSFYT